MRGRRRVVIADVRGRTVHLKPAQNGSGMSPADVRALATAAALVPHTTPSSTFIGLSALPDFEAMCEVSDVVVQRTSPHERAQRAEAAAARKVRRAAR